MKLAILSNCQETVGVNKAARTFVFDIPHTHEGLINECSNLKNIPEIGYIGNGVIYELNEDFSKVFPLITNVKETLFSSMKNEVDLGALIKQGGADFYFLV